MKIIKEIDNIIQLAETIEDLELKKKIVNSLVVLQEHFDLNVNCVICNQEIVKPRTGQVVCEEKECKDEYYRFKQEEWKSLNEERK